MKITRLNHPAIIKNQENNSTKGTKNRRPKRMIPESKLPSITKFTDILNTPGKFSYMDFERNQGAIEMFRHQINQAIFNYGVDLQYFRKYNTFFKDDQTEENHANLIYGEDTTAEFYASGMIRGYVSVENMAWNFNQIGLEATEQINIFLSIDNFEQSFQDKIAKTETRKFEVDVIGDTIHNEVTGKIYCQEFEANVYAEFSENDMKVHKSYIKPINKAITHGFYKSINYQSGEKEISGNLSGKLKYDKISPFKVYGTLNGELTFHNSKNLEDSTTWKRLAPQVGDYFKFTTKSGISEEWEVSNIFDKNLTKSGLNPLLGKYVYQISAVRRVKSFEKNTTDLEAKNPGEDINEILGNVSNDTEILANQYTQKKGKNVHNQKTNQLGKNVYDYEQMHEDDEYGNIQTKPTSK